MQFYVSPKNLFWIQSSVLGLKESAASVDEYIYM